MIGLIRLAIFGLLFLSAIYFLVAVYSRSVRREKLENEWAEAGKQGDRNAFVDAGLKEYEGSLRKKLILLVFVVPVLVVSVMLYVTNFM